MLSRNSIEEYLRETLEVPVSRQRHYADEYVLPSGPFYVKRQAERRPIVVHPDLRDEFLNNPIPGVSLDKLNHNSAYHQFPPLDPNREPCGYDLEIADFESLSALMIRLGASVSPSSALAEIDLARPSFVSLPETEREAIVSARLGQGLFRKRLLSAWKGRCAVTGVTIEELLRASHIKPWRVSDNSERLDPDNGLLLVANLDAAFDAALVSFQDDGTILLSPRLVPQLLRQLGIDSSLKLARAPSERQRVFLRHHRQAAGLV